MKAIKVGDCETLVPRARHQPCRRLARPEGSHQRGIESTTIAHQPGDAPRLPSDSPNPRRMHGFRRDLLFDDLVRGAAGGELDDPIAALLVKAGAYDARCAPKLKRSR